MRVLLADIDAFCPDHLSCYGCERDTSSTVDTLASESVVFE